MLCKDKGSSIRTEVRSWLISLQGVTCREATVIIPVLCTVVSSSRKIPAEHLLRRQLRWLRHVIRMPDNRLPRRLLYTASSLWDSAQMVAQRNALSTTLKQICSSATSSQVIWRLWQATETSGGLSAILVSGES